MRAVWLLLGSAGLGLAGPVALTRLTASTQRALTAAVAWLAASWSMLGGVVLAGLSLVAARAAGEGRMPAPLESCAAAVHQALGPVGTGLLRAARAGLLSWIGYRTIRCPLCTAVANHRRRSRHRVLLALVSRSDPALEVRVVDDDAAIVYCLPGLGGASFSPLPRGPGSRRGSGPSSRTSALTCVGGTICWW